MREKADPTAPPVRKRGSLADVAPYALTIGAVLLAWQVAIQPLMQRAPVEAAIRMAPGSPLVLRRAAEAELVDERDANAASLARDALARSPFDVRALRVVGLTEARAGRTGTADEILTLAGNWSLRDDPAHAWLVEHRLRRGDYASAFAHADTLVRRREDIRPQVFRLFTVAATEDRARALPEVAVLLAARPPWRQSYLDTLFANPQGLQVAAGLAILLQSSRAPLTNAELRQLYIHLLDKGQLEAVRTVRERLNRPAASAIVTNGGFGDDSAPEPFQWVLAQEAGVIAEIVSDDVTPEDRALRVEYDGFETARIAEQLTFMRPGRYRLEAESRIESGDPSSVLVWTVTCAPGDLVILATPAAAPVATPGSSNWNRVKAAFTIPAACPAQWLRLETRAGDRRAPSAVWFDRVAIAPDQAAAE